jgi:hypothetical protein
LSKAKGGVHSRRFNLEEGSDEMNPIFFRKSIKIVFITRRSLVHDLKDRRLYRKKKIYRVYDVMEHMVSIEFLDFDETELISRFNYFSGYRPFTEKFVNEEDYKKEMKGLFQYIRNIFNENTIYLDEFQNIETVVLNFKEKLNKHTQNLRHHLKSNQAAEEYKGFRSLIYNEDEMKTYDDPDKLDLSSYFKDLALHMKRSKTMNDDQSSEKVMIIFDRMKRVPVATHLGLIYHLVSIVSDKAKITEGKTNDLNMTNLMHFVEEHLLQVYQLYNATIQPKTCCFFFPGADEVNPLKKIFSFSRQEALGRQLPRLNDKSGVYRNLIKAKMMQMQRERGLKITKTIGGVQMKATVDKELKVFVMTWNLAGFVPKLKSKDDCKRVADELMAKMDDPDLIVLNFQELIELKAYNVDTYVGMVRQHSCPRFSSWKAYFTKYFLRVNPNYKNINAQNLMALGTFHFVKKSMIEHISVNDKFTMSFDPLNPLNKLVPKKGATVTSLKIYDSILVLVNCHLPSGEDHLKAGQEVIEESSQVGSMKKSKIRANKVDQIMMKIRNHKSEYFKSYDLLIFSGDLNTRVFNKEFPFEDRMIDKIVKSNSNATTRETQLMEERVEIKMTSARPKLNFLGQKTQQNEEKIVFSLKKNEEWGNLHEKMSEYLKGDEVKQSEVHKWLGGKMIEGSLPVLPTYKVKKKSSPPHYDDKRNPSWTDRILYHKETKSIKISNYANHSFYLPYSDHM